MHVLYNELRSVLVESVKRNLSEGILLSGGLDTSILAYLSSKWAKPKAFTVAFRNAPAPDVDYARLMAYRLSLKHLVYHFDENELYDAIRVVIKVMDSFDPMEVRNDITVYIGLKIAKENGVNTIMTGDGCDELFAGYSFLFGLKKEELSSELQKIWKIMSFSSVRLADFLNLKVKLPCLDHKFKKFAMQIDPDLKVRSERGQIWGKWVLRKAFENSLPKEVVWRAKDPIEVGSGTSVLPLLFDSMVSDSEFSEKRERYFNMDGVTVRDKEQLFYYEIFRSEIGAPRPTDPGGKTCPLCHSSVPTEAIHCKRCGGYPI